jgi:hypothetical protein
VLDFKYSYFTPVIEGVDPGAVSTRGGMTVRMAGSDFGLSGRLVLLNAGAGGVDLAIPASSIQSYSHSQIEFEVPASQGGPYTLRLNVSSQFATSSFDFLAPIIEYTSNGTRPCIGGDPYTLIGDSFGRNLPSAGRVTEVTIGGQLCPILPASPSGLAHDHGRIVCNIPPGLGADLDVLVTVRTGSTSKTSAPAKFSYDPPTVSKDEEKQGGWR